MGRALVAGAGGFIGGHLVRRLLDDGWDVTAIDIKPLADWHQQHPDAMQNSADLSSLGACRDAVQGVDSVYNLAADMGGMGFIENHKALCMLSVLINTHLLLASREAELPGTYFFSSSACVYAAGAQRDADVRPLRESDAYPAEPEDGYGWEKLFSERMCRHFGDDFGLQTRVARYHNVYGPFGTFEGGREKAPAAVCRKIAAAVISGDHSIDIWGDGKQTRSFTYIDDCVEGTRLIAEGSSADPVNLGSEELVSIDGLVSLVEDIAGIRVKRQYDLDAPQGVRGRNSDNTLIRSLYDWAPSIPLAVGMEQTYKWIFDQMAAST